MSSYKSLTDNDKMPFGKYKNQKMIDVPAHWLLWFKENGSPGNVMDYIDDNLAALLKEDEGKGTRESYNKKKSSFKSMPTELPKVPTGPVTIEEIKELINKRGLELSLVIDAFIDNNGLDSDGISELAEYLLNLTNSKKNKAPVMGWEEAENEDSWLFNNSKEDDLPF